MSLVPQPMKDAKGQFILGHIAHPGCGRPKGSRNLLGEAMLTDLYHDWLDHGAQAVTDLRENYPVEYMKIVTLLVSKCDDAIYERISHDSEIEAIIEERRRKVLEKLQRTRE